MTQSVQALAQVQAFDNVAWPVNGHDDMQPLLQCVFAWTRSIPWSSCHSGEGNWVFHADDADSFDMLTAVESGSKAFLCKKQIQQQCCGSHHGMVKGVLF